MGERDEPLWRPGEDPDTVLLEEPGDKCYPLISPVEEVHLDICTARLLERRDLAGRKRCCIAVHRYHCVPG